MDEHIRQIEMKKGDRLFSMFVRKSPAPSSYQVHAVQPARYDDHRRKTDADAAFDKVVAEKVKQGYSVVSAWTRNFQGQFVPLRHDVSLAKKSVWKVRKT